jgi:hypothetical protein
MSDASGPNEARGACGQFKTFQSFKPFQSFQMSSLGPPTSCRSPSQSLNSPIALGAKMSSTFSGFFNSPCSSK